MEPEEVATAAFAGLARSKGTLAIAGRGWRAWGMLLRLLPRRLASRIMSGATATLFAAPKG